MDRINFGIVKSGLFKKLTESLDKHDTLDGTLCVEFYDLVKETPFLQLENIFYKNILNKYIENKDLATKYLDENINLFRSFSKADYRDAHEKLKKFALDESSKDKELFTAIDTVLFESLNFKDTKDAPNIDSLHESYCILIKALNTPKKTGLFESKMNGVRISDRKIILKNAINKFNEKYSHLSEDDKALMKILTTEDEVAKKNLFENLKRETHEILKKSLDNAHSLVNERTKQAIEKIDRMQYLSHNATEDIIKLHNLKNNKK